MPARNRKVALCLSSPCAGHACPGQGERRARLAMASIDLGQVVHSTATHTQDASTAAHKRQWPVRRCPNRCSNRALQAPACAVWPWAAC